MPSASWSRLSALVQYRIPAYQGAQVAAVWVGTSRPASWACRGATAAGNAMAKHGARVARRRDCAAFGYVVNRATSDRVQPLRFFILVGSREGCRRWPFRPWREGESPHGVWGATPCRGATIGCGRDAGIWYWRVQGAAPDQTVSRSENIVRSLSFAKHPLNSSFFRQKVLA